MAHRHRHSRLAPITAGLAALGVFVTLTSAFAAQQVTITAPASNTVVQNTIRVTVKLADESRLGYAILLVDQQGCSASNALPLRYMLDTTQLTNGPHTLLVDVYNASGQVISSQPVKILVTNPSAVELPVVPVVPAIPTTTSALPSSTDTTTQPGSPASPSPASMPSAPATITVTLDGAPLELSPSPYIHDGRTIVTLRPLLQALGGKLQWSGERGSAVILDHQITFTLGSPHAMVDGYPVKLDCPLFLQNGRVMAPATLWRSIFAGRMGYDPDAKIVWLRSPETFPTTLLPIATAR